MNPSRRTFLLGAAALGFTPIVSWRHALGAPPPPDNGKFLVVVNLMGGNDGVSAVVPAHLQPYYERRPTLAVRDGLRPIGGGHALHPALASLANMWFEGDLHVVQKVGFPELTFSHFLAQDVLDFGVRDIKAHGDGRGWLGRFADRYFSDPPDPLAVIAVMGERSRVVHSTKTDPLVVHRLHRFRLQRDDRAPAETDLDVHFARRILEGPGHGTASGRLAQKAMRDAHALVETVRFGTKDWVDPGNYPKSNLGDQLATVSRLRAARFGTRIFYTIRGGFDTHAKQEGRHDDLLEELDAALGAFAADMKARGEWEDCVVLLISEFGRRNEENGSLGTDHGHGNAFFVLGGGVRGGAMTGDVTEADLLKDQVGVTYDFREIYAQLVGDHLDLDPAPLFPEPFHETGELDLLV